MPHPYHFMSKETEAQKSRGSCLRSHSSWWQTQGPEIVLPILSRGEDTVSLLLHPKDIGLPCPWPPAHLIYTLLLDVFGLMKFPPCPGSAQKEEEEKQPDVRRIEGLLGGMESDVK